MPFVVRSFLLFAWVPLLAQSWLPEGAVTIERQAIPESAHPNRELVLWMEHPAKHDDGPLRDRQMGGLALDFDGCPEMTTGNGYYTGPTRISLIDTRSNAEVNRIPLAFEHGGDNFIVPFRIGRMIGDGPGYYEVPGPREHGEGKPKLLALKDYNGDGQALEAAFFEALGCMGLPTTLVGYSIKQDRVIHYEVDFPEGPRKWIDYLFAQKPQKPGYWKYSIDYSGRCGDVDRSCVERFEIRYDPGTERFKSLLK